MTAVQQTSAIERPPLSRHPRLAAACVVGALGLCAWLQFRGGAADVPAPLVEILEAFFGYPPELSARLIASSTVAGALIVFLYGVIFENRFLPIVVCALGTFVSLACVSRALSAGGLGFPVIALAASLVLLWWMLRTRPRPVDVHATPRRGLSPGWTALGAAQLKARQNRLGPKSSTSTSTCIRLLVGASKRRRSAHPCQVLPNVPEGRQPSWSSTCRIATRAILSSTSSSHRHASNKSSRLRFRPLMAFRKWTAARKMNRSSASAASLCFSRRARTISLQVRWS